MEPKTCHRLCPTCKPSVRPGIVGTWWPCVGVIQPVRYLHIASILLGSLLSEICTRNAFARLFRGQHGRRDLFRPTDRLTSYAYCTRYQQFLRGRPADYGDGLRGLGDYGLFLPVYMLNNCLAVVLDSRSCDSLRLILVATNNSTMISVGMVAVLHTDVALQIFGNLRVDFRGLVSVGTLNDVL